MGYPMTYKRVVNRNRLTGDYEHTTRSDGLGFIAGDLRRLEADMRDERHLKAFAAIAGVSKRKVKIILDVFFEDDI